MAGLETNFRLFAWSLLNLRLLGDMEFILFSNLGDVTVLFFLFLNLGDVTIFFGMGDRVAIFVNF